MTAQALKPILARRPFQPFIIVLDNGRQHPVSEPRKIGYPDDLSSLIVFGDHTYSVLAPEAISEVIPLP